MFNNARSNIEIMNTKKWYDSKTLWVNALIVVGGVLTAVAGQLAAGETITALGLLNIVLRLLTNQQISK